MPVYKDETKKKNKFWFEIHLGMDERTGKRVRIRKKGFSTEVEAKKAMNKVQVEIDEGEYIPRTKTSFGHYIQEIWLPNRTDLAKTTKSLYETNIRVHICNSKLSKIELSKLSPINIQEFINSLRDKNLSDTTIKKIYNIICTSLNAAVGMKLIKENIAEFIISKPKIRKTTKNVWNTEDVKFFLSRLSNSNRYNIAYRLALMTGMRQGELLGLRWNDIDFDNNAIYVSQTLSHDGKEIRRTAKTSSGIRSIHIDDDTKVVLKKHREIMHGEKELMGFNYKDNDLVICTLTGMPCSPRNIMRQFYKLLDGLDMPKITFHDLRHTHATMMLQLGINPKIVSERLGHASVKLTLDLYSHVSPTMQREASEKLKDLLSRKVN